MNAFLSELSEFSTRFTEVLPQVRLDIKIVDNNSTDRSMEILRQSPMFDRVQVLQCPTQGYGAALKCGFQNSKSDYYAFADLDHTYPLQDLLPMLRLMQHQSADMVLGVRVHSGSQMGWVRWVGNVFYKLMTNVLFASSLSDSCSGMRIFTDRVKTEILELNRSDLSFSIELTAKALQKKWALVEYPIAYRDRLGDSKLSVFSDGLKFLLVLMRVKFFG